MPNQPNLGVTPRTFEYYAGRIDFASLATVTLEIPNTNFVKEIILNLVGACTVGTAAWTAMGTESPANILRKVEITWGGETIKSYSGGALYRLSCFDKFHNITRTQPVTAGTGAKTFECPLFPTFMSPHAVRPVDTILPAFQDNRKLYLKVTWGDGSELGVKDTTTTVTMGTTYVDVVVRYASIPEWDNQAFSIFRELESEVAIPATTANFAVDLMVGAGIYRAFMLQTYSSDLHTIATGIMNAMSLRSSTSIYHRTLIPEKVLRAINYGGVNFAPAAGNYLVELCDEGRLAQGIASGLLNELQFILDVTVSGAPILHYTSREIVPPSGATLIARK